jgi:putative RNA 2'-phosphotransferase
MKELLQALHEESAWRYVRHSHIKEVLLSDHREHFDATEKSIRASERNWTFGTDVPWDDLPKILLAPVRRKAHPVVLENGLKAPPARQVVLAQDATMAERIGMRRDPQPVLLEVRAAEAAKRGTGFAPFGGLYLCNEVPARWIAGPPVPREQIERQTTAKFKPEKAKPLESPFTAGTFLLDEERDPDRRRRTGGRKSKGWKEDARKMRKRK